MKMLGKSLLTDFFNEIAKNKNHLNLNTSKYQLLYYIDPTLCNGNYEKMFQ